MFRTPDPLPSDVFITSDLQRRPVGEADYLQEKKALQDLAIRMADDPGDVLPRFVELAMTMSGGVSAGLSILDPHAGPDRFQWRHIIGRLAAFEGTTTPRDDSPCGVTIDARVPVLTRHSERLYGWIAEAGIVAPEVLLVPLFVGQGEPLGTLWILSDDEGHFNAGHARVATELATFVSIALRMLRTDRNLRQALEEQAMLAREMNHRVKNVLAMADSIVRFGARDERSKEEMVASVSGRLQALARAHALVMRGLETHAPRTSRLDELIATIVKPHQDGADSRFKISGPELLCGAHAVAGLSLVLHELATNAAKYGALVSDSGAVSIDWSIEDGRLRLIWAETGGAPIDGPPARDGFGSRLVDTTILRQFGGTVDFDWRREGLVVTIEMPVEAVAQ